MSLKFYLRAAQTGLLVAATAGYVLTANADGTWEGKPVGGGGAVTSVFSRVGAVTAQTGDYDSDQIDNVSAVPGASVSDALDYVLAHAGAVASVFGRAGIVTAQTGDYTATQVTGALRSDGTLALAGSWSLGNQLVTGAKVIAYQGEVDDGNSGAAKTVDWTQGQFQKLTLTANCTLTLTAPAGPCRVQLKLIQDGVGSRTVTWPGSVNWAGGFPPILSTAAASTDIVTLFYDGAVYWGAVGPTPVDGVSITQTGAGAIRRAALTGDVTAAAGSNATSIAAGVIVNSQVNAAAAIAGTKISPDFGAQNVITTGNITVNGGYFAVGTTNLPSTGSIRLVNASTIYSITTALADSKVLHFSNGNSAIYGDNPSPTLVNGSTTSLRVSNADYVVCSGSVVGLSVVNLRFDSSLSNPVFFHQTTVTNGVTGQIFTIHAQDCSGTTTTGGPIVVRPGSGTTAGGTGKLQTGGTTNRFQWNDTGIGFFTTAPVAQQNITGSRGGNAALADLLTKLALTGLITDGTTV